jgi:hypothetical protein
MQLTMEWETLAAAVDAESIQGRFAEFDRRHPEVYAELKRMALVKLAEGHTTYGLKKLVEDIRWERKGIGDAEGEFKVNNIFTSRYVRKLTEDCPELAGMFRTRTLTAK